MRSAGKRDGDGEPPEGTAARELEEEGGLRPRRLDLLMKRRRLFIGRKLTLLNRRILASAALETTALVKLGEFFVVWELDSSDLRSLSQELTQKTD